MAELALDLRSQTLHQISLQISRHLASKRSNTYNQANNWYGDITPKHMNKQHKNILRNATRTQVRERLKLELHLESYDFPKI